MTIQQAKNPQAALAGSVRGCAPSAGYRPELLGCFFQGLLEIQDILV